MIKRRCLINEPEQVSSTWNGKLGVWDFKILRKTFFWGGETSCWVSKNYTRQVRFESPLPKWHVLSEFNFKHCLHINFILQSTCTLCNYLLELSVVAVANNLVLNLINIIYWSVFFPCTPVDAITGELILSTTTVLIIWITISQCQTGKQLGKIQR